MAGSFRIPDKALVLAAWEPVIGHPAATALYRGKYVLGAAKWVALADFAIVFVAVHSVEPLWAGRVAWWVGILAIGYIGSGFYFVWKWHKEAGRALGIKITGKNAPPSDRDRYLQWCRRNNVQPLSSRTANAD